MIILNVYVRENIIYIKSLTKPALSEFSVNFNMKCDVAYLNVSRSRNNFCDFSPMSLLPGYMRYYHCSYKALYLAVHLSIYLIKP